MEIVHKLLLFLHILGLASLLGGFLVQMKGPERRVVPAIVHGALVQLVTGVLLVGVLEVSDEDVNHAKIGVKLLVGLVITVMALVMRKYDSLGKGLFFSMFALSVVNAAVAVFW